jgi:hypothetical protein
LQGVQVGARRALASGEGEVAGEVGEGQLMGGNQLTRGPLPAGIPDRDGVWRPRWDEGWLRPLHGTEEIVAALTKIP